jgi:prepilin-type processing-associated H-X9-DG protein/prepilin-type N-terminal cleavage/methylation domain-containing protein
MTQAEPRHPHPGAIPAFSLTELLVVIAIIAILAALLIPSLSLAKTKSQASVCLSNIKQWGLATLLYTEESNDIFPYEGVTGFNKSIDKDKNLRAWYNVVPPLIDLPSLKDLYARAEAPLPKSRSIFSCPNTVAKPAPVLTPTNAFFMYGFNCRLDPNDPDDDGKIWLQFNLSQVQQPSKTILLGDNSESTFPTTSGRYAPARHNKHANFAFVDGHAQPVHTNNYCRIKEEDEDSGRLEWKKPREVYWYPFPTASE